MYYTVYKTTNKINGKIYIGCHKTKDLDDGYLGSGKLLGYAINKYGIENFNKEILAVFDKSSEMFDMESELVNEEFIAQEDNYNLKLGGSGGFDYIRNHPNYKDWQAKGCKKGGETLHIPLDEFKKRVSEGVQNTYNNGRVGVPTYANLGKKFTKEHKEKIGKANAKLQKGSGNSQYGTMWIMNLELQQCKKIKKDDHIPEGWIKGRKYKF